MIKKNKKGVALLWSLVLITVLMVITGSMVSVIINESRMTLDVVDSSQSYANAKTGIEWANKYITVNKPSSNIGPVTFNLGSAGSALVSINTCTSPCRYVIQSKGLNINASIARQIERKIYNTNPVAIKADPIFANTNIGSNQDSFTINFDFWLYEVPPTPMDTYTIYAGVQDTTGADSVGLRLSSANVLSFYSYDNNIQTLFPLTSTPTIAPDGTRPYVYRANIKYIKDTHFIVRISEKDHGSVNQDYVCISNTIIPVQNIDYGNLQSMALFDLIPGRTYYSNIWKNTYPPTGLTGDGEIYKHRRLVIDNFEISK